MEEPVFIDYSRNGVFAVGMCAHYMLSGGEMEPFASLDSREYSAASYNPLSPDCAEEAVRNIVWAMCHPEFESRLTAEQALDRVQSLCGGLSSL
jgi:hypothetical protein